MESMVEGAIAVAAYSLRTVQAHYRNALEQTREEKSANIHFSAARCSTRALGRV
jgi:hypothetical protein